MLKMSRLSLAHFEDLDEINSRWNCQRRKLFYTMEI